MNGNIQSFETRTETIFRITALMFHDTRISWSTFAQKVVELYHDRVTEAAREVQFKTVGDLFQCATINAQKLKRYVDGDVNARLPVDLEESWVFALSEPFRDLCLRELAARYGLLAVRAPTGTPSDDVLALARLSKEFGETFSAMAPVLDEGRVTASDIPHLDFALEHLQALTTAAADLQARIERVLPARHKPRVRTRRGR